MRKYHEINDKNFMEFRSFFSKDEYRWHRWPSGAFSAWIPIIDILIWLNILEEANKWYLNNVENLYPRDGRIMLSEVRKRSKDDRTIADYAGKLNYPILWEIYRDISEGIILFRWNHLGVIKNVANDIYNWTLDWSWWLWVREFLMKNLELNINKTNPGKWKKQWSENWKKE